MMTRQDYINLVKFEILFKPVDMSKGWQYVAADYDVVTGTVHIYLFKIKPTWKKEITEWSIDKPEEYSTLNRPFTKLTSFMMNIGAVTFARNSLLDLDEILNDL